MGRSSAQGGPLSAPPALSDPGWPQLSPMEQRGFENQVGVWDMGPSPIRRIPPRGQRARGGGAAATNPYQRGFSVQGAPSCVGSRACALPQGPPSDFFGGISCSSSSHQAHSSTSFMGHGVPQPPVQLPFPFLASLAQATQVPSSCVCPAPLPLCESAPNNPSAYPCPSHST